MKINGATQIGDTGKTLNDVLTKDKFIIEEIRSGNFSISGNGSHDLRFPAKSGYTAYGLYFTTGGDWSDVFAVESAYARQVGFRVKNISNNTYTWNMVGKVLYIKND